MTNYECIMLGIEIGRVCLTDSEIDTTIDNMVAAGWIVAAEGTKIRVTAKRVVLIMRSRFPMRP